MTFAIKVMLVDDEPLVRESFTLRMPWEQNGFHLIGAAKDGEEALCLMEQEQAHIVLLDITMPGMSGMELAEIITARWPGTRVVFLSAHNEFDYVKQALLLGADDYLLKVTVTPDELIEKCIKVSEKVRASMEQERLRSKEARMLVEYDSSCRREKLLRWVEGVELPTQAEFQHPPEGAYLNNHAVIWLAWEAYPPIRNGTHTAQSLKQIQLQISQQLASKPDSPAVQLEVYPYFHNKLAIALSCGKHLSAGQTASELVYEWGKQFKSLYGIDCFAIVYPTRLETGQLRYILQRGPAILSYYFYEQTRIVPLNKASEMLPPSSTPWLDLVARAQKTFYGCGLAYLEEIHYELMLMIDKKVPPGELYRIAGAIVAEERDPNIRNLRESLEWIETVQEYKSWWEELLAAAKRYDPLGQKVIRKEIQELCKYISKHFREDLQLSVLADSAGFSVNYLGMLFRQETGQSFSDYLMRVRMMYAKELLERSTYMIYEVANEVGLTDYRYFCKTFKKMYGITPTQYKSGTRVEGE